ncbi:hypothetical protein HMPREF1624_06559 [Sporothrix schenckii ATCC 58251]|uniref:chitinase n=1 Tax=Sporothrix schenckii (strain ATCC 58251 / de Perez 2211183) TaxID=1391915 RepID=U7PNL1_SPOS1|nr:hypothetical protein HMPREF1624_06559 [Sporothrix schenckii ATCC 58251]
MLPSWSLSTAAVGFVLLSSGLLGGVNAEFKLRQPAAPNYRSRNNSCPTSCTVTGPNPANWPAYKSLQDFDTCHQTIFYHISLFDTVDDLSSTHRIYACASNGSLADAGTSHSTMQVQETVSNATFKVGHWSAAAGVDLRALSQEVRKFLNTGYQAKASGSTAASTSPKDQAQILFAQTMGGTVGLYVGKDVQSLSYVSSALEGLEASLTATKETTGTVVMELCGTQYNADHVIGFIATSNTSFTPVQQVLRVWSNATCIDNDSTETFVSPVGFTTPLDIPSAGLNSTALNGTVPHHVASRSGRLLSHPHASLSPRADCSTVQVVSGDSCSSLATKCGISPADFTKYNPDSSLCATLTPGQHVCCSSGTLPDFAPKPNSDGSCYSYTVVANDNCAAIAATYDLTNDLIESFNNATWGWQGCNNVLLGAVICLSTGSPPMPAAVANAECGPQVTGTVAGPGGTYNLSGLNPCPLNACCDIWGQCGVTDTFCVDTSLGPPGTAKQGTNGCISNCGTDIVSGSAPSSPVKLAYYEGYGMDRQCLFQDISQLASDLTHVHFAFATLDPDTYNVSVGSVYSSYEFDNFARLGSGVHRVITIGGWSFSTDPSTYQIFRNGVTAANRVRMAMAIADFVKQHNLDGVDIDWEYPGAPDIPGIPAASTDDGANYLDFLVVLKNLLPFKTVSIAAPASYWYLKNFPIQKISKVVDYIVYMTYDLHGQWDSGNSYSQDDCPTGTCLRSHVNLTETLTSLSMITKAGVPANKVIVGVTSYGRSFGMTDPNCYDPQCTYGGGASGSTAAPGPCTGTAGYLADAEIHAIISGMDITIDGIHSDGNNTNTKRETINSTRVDHYYYDEPSDSQILVYDTDQWVSFMTPSILSSRATKYNSYGFGGTTNWASDLETFNAVPGVTKSWGAFLEAVGAGLNPMSELSVDKSAVHGNWTKLSCTNPAVVNALTMSPQERWAELDGADAWADVINVWTTVDQPAGGIYLSESISNSIHGPEDTNCGTLAATSNCDSILLCKDVENISGTGPAAYVLWNSLVYVHEMYETLHDAIVQAAAVSLDPSLPFFEDTFAPVVPPSDTWLSVLFALSNLAGTMVVSSVFNSLLKGLPYFRTNPEVYDNGKDLGKALESFTVSVMGIYIKGNEGSWSAGDQDSFSSYLGQVINVWTTGTEAQLESLFSGSNDSITLLTSLVGQGQFLEGSGASPQFSVSNATTTSVAASIMRAFYAFAIPSVWSASGTNAFVLDAGDDCSKPSAYDYYVDSSIQEKTMACIDDHLYFLVYPKGVAREYCYPKFNCPYNKFSAPPGIDDLDGTAWGGITVTDIINGSVRSYQANGLANDAPVADPSDPTTLTDLYNQDITTPGYIRLPVCTGPVADYAWLVNRDKSAPNWPCIPANN